jgi:hypothetical protein
LLSGEAFHRYALEMSGQGRAETAEARVLRARLREMEAHPRASLAKVREIEAHRRAIAVHERTAALFQELGLKERAATVRERTERTRAMLDLAIREAEQYSIDIS